MIIWKCDHPWQNQPYCAQNCFELWQALPSMALDCCRKKFEVSSPCSFWRYKPKCTQLSHTEISSKCSETLLRILHAEVCILAAVYAKYVAPPTKSVHSMVTKSLEWEQQSTEKIEKTSVSKAHMYTKSKKELAGNIFVNSCHTCLSVTIYGNSSVSWTLNVATRLTLSSRNCVCIAF